jgi:hypothetical protein
LNEVEQMMALLSWNWGTEDLSFPDYTVQTSGLKNIRCDEGRRLHNVCARGKTEILGHGDCQVVPRSNYGVSKRANLIARGDDASKAEVRGDIGDEEGLLSFLRDAIKV